MSRVIRLPTTVGGREALKAAMRWQRRYGPSADGLKIHEIDWDELDRSVTEAQAEIASYGKERADG